MNNRVRGWVRNQTLYDDREHEKGGKRNWERRKASVSPFPELNVILILLCAQVEGEVQGTVKDLEEFIMCITHGSPRACVDKIEWTRIWPKEKVEETFTQIERPHYLIDTNKHVKQDREMRWKLYADEKSWKKYPGSIHEKSGENTYGLALRDREQQFDSKKIWN